MRKIILLLGAIFIVAPIRAEKPPTWGEMKLEIKAFEDRTIYAKTKVIELKNLLASEIEPFIRSRLSMYGAVQVNDALNTIIITDMEPKLSDLVRFVKKLDAKGIKKFVRLETQTLHPKYVLPSKLDSILRKNLSPEGSIQVDDDLNAIMITDVKSRIERIKEILSAIDIPPKQVLIEGKLVVAESEWLREIGLGISSLGGNAEINVHAHKGGLYTGKLEIWSFGRLDIWLWDRISLGVKEGKVSVSSFPALIVQNNKKGRAYISGYYSNYSTSLSFSPHIGEDNFIDLEIDLDIQIPGGKRGITTSVMVKDDTSFVLGGIDWEETTVKEKGIPVLRSIPIIKWLFMKQIKSVSKKELLIIVTPHILKFGESLKIEKE